MFTAVQLELLVRTVWGLWNQSGFSAGGRFAARSVHVQHPVKPERMAHVRNVVSVGGEMETTVLEQQ